MKTKNLLVLIIMLIFIISCYQQPESGTEGSVSVILKSDIMRDAPAGFDGELTLAIYPAGSLDSLITYPSGPSPTIAYLGDFPNPLKANPSVPIIGRSGELSLLKVPAERPLSLLVEYQGILYAGNPSGPYYLSYATVSAPFTVSDGGIIDVPVSLTPTAYGSISVVRDPAYGTIDTDYIKLYEPADLDAYVNIDTPSPGNITFNTPPSTLNSGSDPAPTATTITFLNVALPGKKMKIMVTDDESPFFQNIGISDTFEVQPGRLLSVPLTYYYFNSQNCFKKLIKIMSNKKYYPGHAVFFSAGLDIYLLYNFNTKKTFFLKRDETSRFSQLSGIKTEKQYLVELKTIKDTAGEIDANEKMVSQLIKNGLLIPWSDFKDTDNKKNYDNKPAIALITFEKPQFLSKALESIAKVVQENHPEIPLTIFDNSTNKEVAVENRQITMAIGENYRLKPFYFGKDEKEHFIKKLKIKIEKKGICLELLKYAFFGNPDLSFLKGAGGNRNAALLKLAGNKIISFDDDTQYNFKSAINTSNKKINISSSIIPEINLFDDINKIDKILENTEIDIISYINEILGKDIRTLIDKSGNFYDGTFTKDICIENYKQSVKTAMAGVYGGKWYNNPFSIYLNHGSERIKSYTKKSEYYKIKENPVSLMLSHCLNLSRAPFFIATSMGIDTTEITPPFPPHLRADDNIWITTMLALDKNSFIAHIPFAIYHETINKIPFTNNNYEDTSADIGLMSVFIIEHLKRNLLLLFPEITYESLGNRLIALSKLPDEHFTSLCHDLWLEYTGNTIAQLESLLIRYKKKPGHWVKDVEQFIFLLETQSVIPENALPKELRINYSTQQTVKLYKLFLKDYGKLLMSWPVIWGSAIELNMEESNQS